MSLLNEKVTSVVQLDAVSKSNVILGPKQTVIESGLNYAFYVVKASPTVRDEAVVLLDVVTNQPIHLGNQLIISVIYSSDPDDPLSADPATAFEFGGLTPELTNYASYGSSAQFTEVERGYYSNQVNCYTSASSDYAGNNVHPVAAIFPFNGTGAITGTLLLKIQTTKF